MANEEEPAPAFIPGIDNWPWLRFQVDDPARERFAVLRHKDLKPNTVIDWRWLERMGVARRVQDLMGDNVSPWDELFGMGHKAYRQLTLEVFCTFLFRPRPADAEELDEGEISLGRAHAEVSFRAFGEVHRMSLRRFAVVSDLYTDEETRSPMYTTATYREANDTEKVWWRAIGDGVFVPGTTKAVQIRDPLYRYLHRLIATSITGRFSGADKVNYSDLFYLRCLLKHTPYNLAHGLADCISGYYHRSKKGPLVGGNIVTQIAVGLEYGAQRFGEFTIPGIPPKLAGENTARGMKIIKKFPDDSYRFVRDWFATPSVEWVPEPLVDPLEFEAPEVDFEDRVEGPDGEDVAVSPPHQPPPPPQHPPRVYRAVRLPAQVQAAIYDTQRQMREMRVAMQWVVDHIVDDRTKRGLGLLSPAPALPPFQDPPGAAAGDDAGDGAGPARAAAADAGPGPASAAAAAAAAGDGSGPSTAAGDGSGPSTAAEVAASFDFFDGYAGYMME